MKFLPGQQVKCIDNYLREDLVKGQIYTVNNTQGDDLVTLIGLPCALFNEARFELCTSIIVDVGGSACPYSKPSPVVASITAGTGIKHDAGKPDMSLLSHIALSKVAEVMTFGKKKYAAHNWRGGFVWSRPAAAALRHIFSWLGGEDKDPESGISHLAHAACCLLFLLEFEDTHKELDDRYKSETKVG